MSVTSLGALFNKAVRPLKRLDVGLQACRDATKLMAAADEEVGHWWYLVVDPDGIKARVEPNYRSDKCASTPHGGGRFTEGTIVEVTRRRKAGWTTWLCPGQEAGESGGDSTNTWLFDVSPKDRSVRMVEVEVLPGDWHLRVCGTDPIPVLPKPAPALAAKPLRPRDDRVDPGEEVSGIRIVRQLDGGSQAFLELPQGRGWVCSMGDRGRSRLEECGAAPCSTVESSPNRRPFEGQRPELTMPSDVMPPSSSPGSFSTKGLLFGCRSASATTLSPSSPLRGLAWADSGDRPPVANGDASIGPDAWTYVVLDPCGVSLRKKPTYDPKEKLQSRIEEGQLVNIVEKHVGESTTFLRVECPPGWVFDRQPHVGRTSSLRMMQVYVEQGLWYYAVLSEFGVALRSRCSFSDSARCGKGPLKHAVVEVNERVRIGESTFLRLANSGHWLFDVKGKRTIMHGPMQYEDLPEGTEGVVQSVEGVALMHSPTTQKWATTKMKLLKDSKVQVLRSLEDRDGCLWYLVYRPGGICEGWLPAPWISVENRQSGAKSRGARKGFTADQVAAALSAPSASSYH